MKKINKILHMADIHFMNKLSNQEEQELVKEEAIKSVAELKPDMVVIVGDLFHDFINISNESKARAGSFINRIANEVCPVVITSGNHDLSKKNKDRKDSVQTVVDLLSNKNIHYLNSTNFYDFDNITFAVWHHIDKQSPWAKFPEYKKDDKRTYIDLFHDPINGCLTESKQLLEREDYVKLGDFKGDIVMAGDIHLHQSFEKNKKPFFVYPGSLYETKYSEGDGNFHGFVLWDIEKLTFTKIPVKNKFSHINFYIKEGYDYDDIKINIKTTEYTRLKIHWSDTSSNINSVNERNIRKYIKETYPQVKELRFDKKPINKDKIKLEDENKLKNINNIITQQEVFSDYLKNKGYDNEFITEVLQLDDIINKRLGVDETNHSFDIKINKVKFSNFRNYGDDNELNFDSLDGIVQVSGNNRVGKSTISNFIMYMLYGKTPSTQKKEKNGDNRFINNKRDLDYCEGELYLTINNVKYLIKKRTERKWNRAKTEITACPTTVEYYMLDDNDNPIIDESGEQKKDTIKVIEDAIGSYEDFIRKAYTDADNLNSLISNDRAVFIDNLLLDTNLNIFDLKNEEYKNYKKETYKKEEKIVIDVIKAEEDITNYQNLIKESEDKLTTLKAELLEIDKAIKKGVELKETEIKKLHKIDNDLISTNSETIKENINKLISDKEIKLEQINNLENEINNLKSSYDEQRFAEIQKEKENYKEWVSNKKHEIKQVQYQISDEDAKISNLNGEILTKNRKIEQLNTNIQLELQKIDNELENIKNKVENEKTKIDNEISLINKEILLLEKSKTCPTCDREYGSEQLKLIESKIADKKVDIVNKEKEKTESEFITKMRLEYKNKLTEKTNSKAIANIQEEIKNIKEEIVKTQTFAIPAITNTIEELKLKIPKIESEINKESLRVDGLNEEMVAIELIMKEVEKRKDLIRTKDTIPLLIENIELRINNEKERLSRYEKEIVKVSENEKIQLIIDKYQNRLDELETNKNSINININNIINNEINAYNNNITTISERIKKFKEQERKEMIQTVYQDCIHRDGLPTILLKKLVPTINEELTNLLEDSDFTIWFDEDLNLKMASNKYIDSTQNVIDGSGYERSVCTLALKMALNRISNKVKFDFLIMDEILGKVNAENLERFISLIHKCKNMIGKVFIIEHFAEVNPDSVINVYADENEISYFDVHTN